MWFTIYYFTTTFAYILLFAVYKVQMSISKKTRACLRIWIFFTNFVPDFSLAEYGLTKKQRYYAKYTKYSNYCAR